MIKQNEGLDGDLKLEHLKTANWATMPPTTDMNDQAQPSRHTTLKHRRFNVKTLNRRCFNVVCPLGTLWSRIWREPSFSLRTDSSCENQRRMFGASEMDLNHQNVFFFFLSFFLVDLRLWFWYYSVIVGPCDWSLWFIFSWFVLFVVLLWGSEGVGVPKTIKILDLKSVIDKAFSFLKYQYILDFLRLNH